MSSIPYFYQIYYFSSIFIILYAFFKDKGQMSIDWSALAKFTGFMALLTMYRLCLYDSGLAAIHKFPVKMYNFLFVFLEDAFFVMIPFYITKLISKKWINFIIWTLFSVLFASGHVYQGLFIAAITGLYPYFISRKYAVRTTFGTVMACHFMYDCFTYCTVKLAKLFMYV